MQAAEPGFVHQSIKSSINILRRIPVLICRREPPWPRHAVRITVSNRIMTLGRAKKGEI